MNAYMSFTSIPPRLPHIDAVVEGHVRLAERHGLAGVCMALQEDAVPLMTDRQRELVSEGRVELLTVPKDHGSNTKWTLARAAHPDAALVVVDDDRVYPDSMVADFLAFADRYPGALAARALRVLARAEPGEPISYSLSRRSPHFAPLRTCLRHRGGPGPVGRDVVLEHWAGMWYPPGFPDAAHADEAAELAPHDDDVFLTSLVNRAALPAYLIPTSDGMIYLRDMAKEQPAIRESALGRDNHKCGWTRTQDALNRLREHFF